MNKYDPIAVRSLPSRHAEQADHVSKAVSRRDGATRNPVIVLVQHKPKDYISSHRYCDFCYNLSLAHLSSHHRPHPPERRRREWIIASRLKSIWHHSRTCLAALRADLRKRLCTTANSMG